MKQTLGTLLRRMMLTMLLLAPAASNAADADIIRGTDHYRFTYRITLPDMAEPGKLFIPLARSGPYQSVRVEGIRAPVTYETIKEREHGNEILFLRPGPEQNGKVVEIVYEVQRREKPIHPALAADLTAYLKPDRLVPKHETFQSIAREVIKDVRGDFAKGRALYDHVLERMRYDKSGVGWGRGDALHACDSRAGNCTDFHAYFIALARAVNIPARFAIGATIPADKDEGNIAGYHCWAEFHAEGKWVPVDISEASRNKALAEYYFGHHPANRLEMTIGRDLVFEPGPSSGPVNFLIYPLLEVGGKEVKAEFEWSFSRIKG